MSKLRWRRFFTADVRALPSGDARMIARTPLAILGPAANPRRR
ncbi:hypothetical protein [Nocardia sp. CDC160]|nr:hypothetical protein [Nocardia sp. CDC160]MEC3915859.1 hypothetical protein [Nocardia sp. CDC160]